MANAAYVATSFGDLHFATRTNSTLTPGVTANENEILFAALYASTNAVSITVPSGWTEYGTTWNLSGTDITRLYYKVAGASEPSSYTWTHASLGTFGAIWITDNVNTTGQPDFLSSDITTSGEQDPSTSGTTTEANVLLYAVTTYISTAVDTPTGFTQVGDLVNTFGVSYLLQASAGGTGTVTAEMAANGAALLILFGVKSEPSATKYSSVSLDALSAKPHTYAQRSVQMRGIAVDLGERRNPQYRAKE